MSIDEHDENPESEPASVPNHRVPLTQREVFELFLRDKVIRPYVFAALGALAMIFFVMFLGGSDVGAVIIVLFGLATLCFRWIAGPPLLLLFLCYFQLFPFGIPPLGYENPFEIRETYFRVSDVILIMAVLVYIRSTYRIFGLILQSMPQENVFRLKGDHPLRRPLKHIEPGEVVWMIGIAAALVIIGQIVWWLLNSLEFTPTEDSFVHWAQDTSARWRRREFASGEFTPGQNRFFIALGVLFFGFLLIRLVFGYWRLRTMKAAEGVMMLTDTSWSESHRERARVEKWRLWGREKVKEQAKKEAKTERERQEKEEQERTREEREDRERERRRAKREAREARERAARAEDRTRRPWE
jgi:hypothetical protein